MNAEPDDLAAPRDPASYARPRLMGPSFWALIAFGVLCVLSGMALARFGPDVFPHRPVEALDARLGQAAPAPLAAPVPVAPSTDAPATAPAAAAEDGSVGARLSALEADQGRVSRAAASALAAAAVVEAAQGSRPFADELARLEAIAPPSADLSALRPLAAAGAPSRAALAASFGDYASRAAAASKAPREGAGLGARLAYALSKVVTVRRIDDPRGDGVDAVLVRAERTIEDGDYGEAARQLSALPPASREALAPWLVRAERRAEIDRRVSAVRAQALADLARAAGEAS